MALVVYDTQTHDVRRYERIGERCVRTHEAVVTSPETLSGPQLWKFRRDPPPELRVAFGSYEGAVAAKAAREEHDGDADLGVI